MPYCPHCPHILEDTNHFLFHCHKYIVQWQKLVTALKRKAFSSCHILTNPITIWHTINYINDSGCFLQIFGNITAEIMEDKKWM
jgi:hypothetical protein